MYVCLKCHEKDRNVTKCSRRWANHSDRLLSSCDVCGKKNYVSHCFAYAALKAANADPLRKLNRKFEAFSERVKKEVGESC
jgi:predicted  nucleic acid-binding Zn-ribbon protein